MSTKGMVGTGLTFQKHILESPVDRTSTTVCLCLPLEALHYAPGVITLTHSSIIEQQYWPVAPWV